MLRKIVSIKNVGRFRNSAAPGNRQLAFFSLILGANGSGKTTLCAILRSLKSGDSSIISGRSTIGAEEIATVELLLADGLTRFDGSSWSKENSNLAIFDGQFISENVHSGEAVNIDHKRNLYHVIIGEEGVRLAQKEAELARQSREKTTEITQAAKEIESHIPRGLTLDGFLKLPSDPEIDARIEEQQLNVTAALQSKEIHDHPLLAKIEMPTAPEDLLTLLTRSIEDIAIDAETLLNEHLEAHDMQVEGGNWIAKGLEHVSRETCPFCGQEIRGLSLINAYQAVFSDRYKAIGKEIEKMRERVDEQFGDRALAHIEIKDQNNKHNAEFWSQFCEIQQKDVALPNDATAAKRALGMAALSLLHRKEQAPLESITADDLYRAAASAYANALIKVKQVNKRIAKSNEKISAKKMEIDTANVEEAKQKLNRLRAMKLRHSESIARLCAEHEELNQAKRTIEQEKLEKRNRLRTHATDAMGPYEQRINHYLDAFNAGFRITKTTLRYPAGIAASTYQLVINNNVIELGDSTTPISYPSFKNTLSSGDRTTLALAFFLAHLEKKLDLASTIVVFDDPFSSQDAFRRSQTLYEIVSLREECGQVIVLSHDPGFLSQVWEKAAADERVALTLADHASQGTKIVPVDLVRACNRRYANDMEDLLAFRNTRQGEPQDVIRKIRIVLESHCWNIYPSLFKAKEDWLGDIVRKIREEGQEHPAYDLYDELNQINDYTKEHHHGEDVTTPAPQPIDPQELIGFVTRTLRIANALQA